MNRIEENRIDWLTEGVLGRRLVGWLLDGIIVAVVGAAAFALCLLFGLLTLGLGWGLFAFLPAIPFAYSVLFLASDLSATPGHALAGLAVRREDDLGRPDLVRAVILTLGYYLTMATSGLLLLVSLFTHGHRALHDMASGLVMVRRDRIGMRDGWRDEPGWRGHYAAGGGAWRR